MDTLFNTGIRPVVDAYLKANSEEVRSYGDYWSASSAGYCMRLNIMRRLGVPPVPEIADSASRTRVFEAGHIFHEWMQRITKNAGLSIAQEVELQDEDLMIRGHFDDLVLVPTGRMIVEGGGFIDTAQYGPGDIIPYSGPPPRAETNLILYDYKTAHSASFNYAKNRPMGDYHTMQLATYMYMWRNPKVWLPKNDWLLMKDRLTEARILSISKDDLRMDEKQLMWSPELEKRVVEYWTTLNGYWKAQKLPKCTCDKMDGGFMARRSSKGKVYNDYFYEDEPCSLKWYNQWKESNATVAS